MILFSLGFAFGVIVLTGLMIRRIHQALTRFA